MINISCEKIILGPEGKNTPPKFHSSSFATLLDSIRYAEDLPALAGAIITDDTILDANAVGSRRYGGEANITINDKFHLGSDTKAITAVLLGILVDEGLVNWTTTLPNIFPEYANVMRPEYKEVTLYNILSHSAGFMRDPNLTLHTTSESDQRAEVVEWVVQQPAVMQKGHYLYSNLGYIVAGAIAEKLTNRNYEDILIERVLRPLGITSAGFGPMGTVGMEDQPLQHTTSHTPVEPTADADNHPIYSPAGRLHMSIKDWAKYIQWVLAAEAEYQNLLKPETAAMLTASIIHDDGGGYYALGWGITNQLLAGGRTLSHAGSNGFNYAIAWLAPGKRFGVILATNQGPGTSANPLNSAATRLIEYHLNGR